MYTTHTGQIVILVISLYMKCWPRDHDELRRGDFIYCGAAGRGMGLEFGRDSYVRKSKSFYIL